MSSKLFYLSLIISLFLCIITKLFASESTKEIMITVLITQFSYYSLKDLMGHYERRSNGNRSR